MHVEDCCIIFGASGQDGYYLGQQCRERGLEVIGISRSASDAQRSITDFSFIQNLISKARPRFIFHLAASSTTRHDAVLDNLGSVIVGTYNILEAVKLHSPDSRVFITGSGLQFHNTGQPIAETDEFEITNAYSLARVSSTQCARYYRSLGILTYVGYLFHHESPRRGSSHVSMMIAKAAQKIAKDPNCIFAIGDINVEKEWVFAGDVTQGIFALVDQTDVFEAAIGSGEGHTIREWLDECFGLVGLNWQEHVRVKQDFKPEYLRLISDPSTILSLGWRPTVGFKQLAQLFIG